MRKISGKIFCEEAPKIEQGAIVEIEVYVLRPTAPSVTIGKARIENPLQFPIVYEILWDDVSLLNKRARCVLGARITRNERLDFLSRVDMPVIEKETGKVLEVIDINVVAVGRHHR